MLGGGVRISIVYTVLHLWGVSVYFNDLASAQTTLSWHNYNYNTEMRPSVLLRSKITCIASLRRAMFILGQRINGKFYTALV